MLVHRIKLDSFFDKKENFYVSTFKVGEPGEIYIVKNVFYTVHNNNTEFRNIIILTDNTTEYFKNIQQMLLTDIEYLKENKDIKAVSLSSYYEDPEQTKEIFYIDKSITNSFGFLKNPKFVAGKYPFTHIKLLNKSKNEST